MDSTEYQSQIRQQESRLQTIHDRLKDAHRAVTEAENAMKDAHVMVQFRKATYTVREREKEAAIREAETARQDFLSADIMSARSVTQGPDAMLAARKIRDDAKDKLNRVERKEGMARMHAEQAKDALDRAEQEKNNASHKICHKKAQIHPLSSELWRVQSEIARLERESAALSSNTFSRR